LANVIEAAEWAKSHRDETFRIIAAETGTPEEITREAYGDTLPDSLVPDLSSDKVEAIVVQKKLLLDYGFLKKDFDVEKSLRVPLLSTRSDSCASARSLSPSIVVVQPMAVRLRATHEG
jgi:ABC-type nitrate/sulfonate/bicarbonate transport system substrate-binding protein